MCTDLYKQESEDVNKILICGVTFRFTKENSKGMFKCKKGENIHKIIRYKQRSQNYKVTLNVNVLCFLILRQRLNLSSDREKTFKELH